jgi:hypothetical protein
MKLLADAAGVIDRLTPKMVKARRYLAPAQRVSKRFVKFLQLGKYLLPQVSAVPIGGSSRS